ncbi:ISAs1 family transposase [Limnoraphis robusta]|uniref:ISAs1 family transposase n=2 Tax=Limnoraphis robusta CCNP1315 TaxID=3110306 RepID=A0ABU5U5B2_9CYAN|nr:ISAs1 family transposase [Limnoraphis robusta]MEA5522377.1 ISAs1 family transposase [Limnoraphis robusta CCNP1315]MEA5547298.1 ISAs1 family transposase [Limnoraphis robusta CCNP1324]
MDSLIKELKKVKDFRRRQGRRHPLWLVLLIVILAAMQGYLGYRAMGDFAKANQQLIVKKFKISSPKVPSSSTIRRVLMGVDWSNLQDIFNQWSSSLCESDDLRDWVCIDGKSLGSTVDNFGNSHQNFVSFVSLYSQEYQVVLGLNCFENKRCSEIKQVQEIIEDLPLKNQVFTLDALHCQKQTVKKIIESKNHYLITVKKNQKKLYQALESVAHNQEPLSIKIEQDKSHGRQIKRQVAVFKSIDSLKSSWYEIKSLIRVERWGKRGKKDYHQVAYYISSVWEKADYFSEKIKGHWQIENRLHWVKDVIFKEDDSSIAHFQARTNLSILQTIAINLFRLLGFVSITEGQRWLNNRWSRLWILLE